MPFNPSGAPVAKGCKSQTTRWLDILPTGAPPHTEQGQLSQDSSEAGDKPDDFSNQQIVPQVSRVPGQLQRDIPQPLASQIYAPRPQTPFHRPFNRSQTPIDRSYTPLSRSLVLSDRPRTPSSRPETPQSQRSSGRPPNIVVPSQNRVFGGVIAYNPAEPSQDLDFPSPGPVPRGRRNIPVEASSSHNALPAQLGHSVAPIPSRETTSMSIPS
ncbi:unnamed protein product [Rhizoctonia solani]|uniref:Uncharacterized protein n=1 Tax=Rhizoctonia solani TaxID=456999 RepID=A0A8H3EAL8_9AGAM|nr:unnamed protein product [Rhizoctonia solani]